MNDRLPDASPAPEGQRFAQARQQRRAVPIYLGHSAASRRVQALIQQGLGGTGSILVSGPHGTGKRTIAEILQHFGESDPADPESAAFAYIHPLEDMSLAEQLALDERLGAQRMLFGTRLDLNGREARERLLPQLISRCSLHIPLPTLAQRIEDLEALAMWIMAQVPSKCPVGGISDYALDSLRLHDWPGNVTELEQVIRQALEIGSGGQIELCDLPLALRLRSAEACEHDSPDFEFSLAHAERSAVERAMRYARGNKRKAARLLRIGKTTLYRKLHGYDAEFDAPVEEPPQPIATATRHAS
jgi:DNA-binding NtrC family response regulator